MELAIPSNGAFEKEDRTGERVSVVLPISGASADTRHLISSVDGTPELTEEEKWDTLERRIALVSLLTAQSLVAAALADRRYALTLRNVYLGAGWRAMAADAIALSDTVEVSDVTRRPEPKTFTVPFTHKASLSVASVGLIGSTLSLALTGNTGRSDLAIGFMFGFAGLFVATLLSALAVRRAWDE